ncbi:MAG: NADH-quinone oxidoreductase subunit NuoK [Candidatus Hodarchaeales archaeon]|jgi:NADH:ubiquinone oxidoreductase subunit K
MAVDNFIIMIGASITMFFVGLYGLMSKDSALKSIMSIELLVASVTISFMAFGFAQIEGMADPQAQTFVILTLSVGGAVIGLAVAILLNVRRKYGSIKLSELTELKW